MKERKIKYITGKNILFWFDQTSPRSCVFNYENYLNRCGFSGTCAVSLELARKFAESKNNVYISHPHYHPNNKNYSSPEFEGYLNYIDFPIQGNSLLEKCDLFIFSFGFHGNDNIDILKSLKEGTIVCAFSHMHWGPREIWNLHNLCKDLNLNFYYIVNSKTSKRNFMTYNIHKCESFQEGVKYVHVNNSISSHVFKEELVKYIELERKNQLIFTSAYSRGGDMARLIAENLNKTFVSTSYLSGAHGSGSYGKKELIRLMRESDYFVYTASDMNGNFPTDTYCNAVHEALACGVIVLTWDISCFREVYGDNIVILDFPDCDPAFNPRSLGTGSHRISVLSDPNNYLKFADKIKELDSNPVLKESIRKRGQDWALSNTYDIEYKNFLRVFE